MTRILAIIALVLVAACSPGVEREAPVDGGLGGTGIEANGADG